MFKINLPACKQSTSFRKGGMNFGSVAVIILILFVLNPTHLSIYAHEEGGSNIENDQGITDTIKGLADRLKDVHITRIDTSGFINRLKNDFRPKEWVSGEDLGPKISQLWLKANEWMESHMGISVEGIGSFIVSKFVSVFGFFVGLLRGFL